MLQSLLWRLTVSLLLLRPRVVVLWLRHWILCLHTCPSLNTKYVIRAGELQTSSIPGDAGITGVLQLWQVREQRLIDQTSKPETHDLKTCRPALSVTEHGKAGTLVRLRNRKSDDYPGLLGLLWLLSCILAVRLLAGSASILLQGLGCLQVGKGV